MADFDSPELLKALEEIRQGNYSPAIRTLETLAQAGNPKAQCNLANIYHFGWGVNTDGRKAVELYSKVAQLGIQQEHLSALACQSFATIYVTGLPDIEPDQEKAARFSVRAKELGFEMA